MDALGISGAIGAWSRLRRVIDERASYEVAVKNRPQGACYCNLSDRQCYAAGHWQPKIVSQEDLDDPGLPYFVTYTTSGGLKHCVVPGHLPVMGINTNIVTMGQIPLCHDDKELA